MPQNKHKSWCGAQHQQATKDADGRGEGMAKGKKEDQEWTYLGPGTKKNVPTSFDTDIAGQHTGEAAEAKEEEKTKKGHNKIFPQKDGTVPVLFHRSNPTVDEELIHSLRARTVIDLCPGSGEPLVGCIGGAIPFMGHTPTHHWPHSEIGPRTPPGTPPADKPFIFFTSGVAGF